jgi:hypothetical protein
MKKKDIDTGVNNLFQNRKEMRKGMHTPKKK